MSREDKNILQYAIGLYVTFLTSALLKNHKCKTISIIWLVYKPKSVQWN